MQYLGKHGATICADNAYILKIASIKGYYDIVKLLIEQGVDIHAENDYAIRIASENGYFAIVKLLVNQ